MFIDVQDFDLKISEVLLAHIKTFQSGRSYSVYQGGRCMEGMICVLAGEGEYRYRDGMIQTLRTGEMAFVPASAAYVVKNAGPDNFTHITINFRIEREGCTPAALVELTESDKLHALSPRSPELDVRLFKAIARSWEQKQAGYRMMCRSMLYELLCRFITAYLSGLIEEQHYIRVLPAKKYMDQCFAQSISLKLLAGMCTMSQTHFRRVFSSVYGKSPIEYLIAVRVLRARDLLGSRLYSPGEVAQLVGMPDANYFSRAFKAHVGLTPTEYRKRG